MFLWSLRLWILYQHFVRDLGEWNDSIPSKALKRLKRYKEQYWETKDTTMFVVG